MNKILEQFVSKKLGVVIGLATLVSQVAEGGPQIALAKIAAYAALGVGYVIAQAIVDRGAPGKSGASTGVVEVPIVGTIGGATIGGATIEGATVDWTYTQPVADDGNEVGK